jgi:Zn finger protein HypA/HybF involved in hydrogenase expression
LEEHKRASQDDVQLAHRDYNDHRSFYQTARNGLYENIEMHEASIARSIVQTVREAAPAGARLRAVNFVCGTFSGVVDDSLLLWWQELTRDSDLAGVQLNIRHVPAMLTCDACGKSEPYQAMQTLEVACSCGRPRRLSGGHELHVESLEVD